MKKNKRHCSGAFVSCVVVSLIALRESERESEGERERERELELERERERERERNKELRGESGEKRARERKR